MALVLYHFAQKPLWPNITQKVDPFTSLTALSVEAQKLPRGGYLSSGLIPFPRTGRSAGAPGPDDSELAKRLLGLKAAGNAAKELVAFKNRNSFSGCLLDQ